MQFPVSNILKRFKSLGSIWILIAHLYSDLVAGRRRTGWGVACVTRMLSLCSLLVWYWFSIFCRTLLAIAAQDLQLRSTRITNQLLLLESSTQDFQFRCTGFVSNLPFLVVSAEDFQFMDKRIVNQLPFQSCFGKIVMNTFSPFMNNIIYPSYHFILTTRFSSGVYFLLLVYRIRQETYSLGFVGKGKGGQWFIRTDRFFFVNFIPKTWTANRFSIPG